MSHKKYKIYHYLEDKPVNHIPVCWKVMHTSAFFISSLLGFSSYYVMKYVIDDFDGNCILNSNLEVEYFSQKNWTISMEYSSWGSRYDCEIPLFVSLFSFIYGGILMMFFLMCGARFSHYGLTPPKKIMLPGLIFCIVFAIITVINCIHVYNGIDIFCHDFEEKTNKKRNPWEYVKSCESIKRLYVKDRSISPDINNLTILKVITMAESFSWIFNSVVIILRSCFVVDHRLMHMLVINFSATSIIDLDFIESFTGISSSLLLDKSLSAVALHKNSRVFYSQDQIKLPRVKSRSVDLGYIYSLNKLVTVTDESHKLITEIISTVEDTLFDSSQEIETHQTKLNESTNEKVTTEKSEHELIIQDIMSELLNSNLKRESNFSKEKYFTDSYDHTNKRENNLNKIEERNLKAVPDDKEKNISDDKNASKGIIDNKSRSIQHINNSETLMQKSEVNDASIVNSSLISIPSFTNLREDFESDHTLIKTKMDEYTNNPSMDSNTAVDSKTLLIKPIIGNLIPNPAEQEQKSKMNGSQSNYENNNHSNTFHQSNLSNTKVMSFSQNEIPVKASKSRIDLNANDSASEPLSNDALAQMSPDQTNPNLIDSASTTRNILREESTSQHNGRNRQNKIT